MSTPLEESRETQPSPSKESQETQPSSPRLGDRALPPPKPKPSPPNTKPFDISSLPPEGEEITPDMVPPSDQWIDELNEELAIGNLASTSGRRACDGGNEEPDRDDDESDGSDDYSDNDGDDENDNDDDVKDEKEEDNGKEDSRKDGKKDEKKDNLARTTAREMSEAQNCATNDRHDCVDKLLKLSWADVSVGGGETPRTS